MSTKAKAWAEQVILPTYDIGEPNPNPMFLENRVYQGSSGVVYPYPVIEWVSDRKEDKEWTALFLENRWLKIMVLPELGGRVHMALDKTNDYHFVYHNRVIKPALVGLCGPWVSGGIEFNWPQHHRPTTYSPVDWRIEEGEDGSVTVWCGEIERMFRTQGIHGFRLRPDRAALEIDVRLYNRTREPQTFLWWANPAVAVNDDYQSVFPPDVHAVMDHGKRDVSDFPIATGEYYKMDYAPGTDISRYKNIPVPMSYMAYHSDYDFVGCYDHGKEAGMVHVADHHFVPGKKQWTWGCGDFGQAWDRALTDEDGPYIELMCGAFTDNQPDFTWLMPGEEKAFVQTFLPYKEIGPARNASRDLVLNLEARSTEASLGLYAIRPGTYRVELWHDTTVPERRHNHKDLHLPAVHRGLGDAAALLFSHVLELEPERPWSGTASWRNTCPASELTMRVFRLEERGETFALGYTPPRPEQPEIPDPATAASPPAEVQSNEELFLHGHHLEQYRHATYRPEPYYEEALRRDPGDSRCNNAMGLLLLRRGKFGEAEQFFRAAICRITQRNPNPYDGEAYYNLGLALTLQGRAEEAEDAFYKAAWSEGWKASAFFELARLASRRGDACQALGHLRQSLARNAQHHKARVLKAALLRRAGRTAEAAAEIDRVLDALQLDPAAVYERERLERVTDGVQRPNDRLNRLEVGLDYVAAGLWDEAEEVLSDSPGEFLAAYLLGWIAHLRGDMDAARERFMVAARQAYAFAFPNQVECVPILETALAYEARDALALYAQGNWWYAHRRYDEAVSCWERCIEADPAFPTAHRNLGLAYMNHGSDPDRARASLEKALELSPEDARVLLELDQLHRKTNRSPGERLALLEVHRDLLEKRDDLAVEYVKLLNLARRHDDALELLCRRRFQPWEGGEGQTTGQYVLALIELARQAMASGDHQGAIAYLERTEVYPANLGEGKLSGARENHVHYHLGCAYEALGDIRKARVSFERAAEGDTEPAAAMYYNDQPAELIYDQGLALKKLGRGEGAEVIFHKLVAFGEGHLDDEVTMDYFAVSLPSFLVFDDDLAQRNQVHCHYIAGLGYLGLGDEAEARRHLERVVGLQADHQAGLLL